MNGPLPFGCLSLVSSISTKHAQTEFTGRASEGPHLLWGGNWRSSLSSSFSICLFLSIPIAFYPSILYCLASPYFTRIFVRETLASDSSDGLLLYHSKTWFIWIQMRLFETEKLVASDSSSESFQRNQQSINMNTPLQPSTLKKGLNEWKTIPTELSVFNALFQVTMLKLLCSCSILLETTEIWMERLVRFRLRLLPRQFRYLRAKYKVKRTHKNKTEVQGIA